MRLLLVCARDPWPPRRGDQLRAVQFIEALRERHNLLVLCPGSPGSESSAALGVDVVRYRRPSPGRIAGTLRGIGNGRAIQSALFRSPELARLIRRHAPSCDAAIAQLVRLEDHLDDFGTTPVVVDLIDCLSMSFEKRAQRDRWWWRPFLRWEARRLLAGECRILERAAATCVVCERDRQHLLSRVSSSAAPELGVVPLACPLADRRGAHHPSTAPGGCTLVLTGNLGYFPNDDAGRWLLREVWPKVRRARPSVKLVVAGARPSWALERLARRHGAELIRNPPDLRGIISRATIALAPLFSGGGTPVKVLEAWAARVPVIATSWAASGASARSGVELLCADGAAEWIGAIERLLDSSELANRLVDAGVERLRVAHSPGLVRESLENLLLGVCAADD